ncbi:hypothetical protein CPB85DRAFT_1443708 [Mucidula mucida]|nr:hypothetical protein CPB85DRAFT_1443708 [Mucidula mucida]
MSRQISPYPFSGEACFFSLYALTILSALELLTAWASTESNDSRNSIVGLSTVAPALIGASIYLQNGVFLEE